MCAMRVIEAMRALMNKGPVLRALRVGRVHGALAFIERRTQPTAPPVADEEIAVRVVHLATRRAGCTSRTAT